MTENVQNIDPVDPDTRAEGAKQDINKPETPNQEAARYRHKLREAEARADALAKSVNNLRLNEVRRTLQDERSLPTEQSNLHDFDPAALADEIPDISSAYGDDGTLDLGKLDGLLEQIRERKPYLFNRHPAPQLPVAPHGDKQPEGELTGDGFAQALDPFHGN